MILFVRRSTQSVREPIKSWRIKNLNTDLKLVLCRWKVMKLMCWTKSAQTTVSVRWKHGKDLLNSSLSLRNSSSLADCMVSNNLHLPILIKMMTVASWADVRLACGTLLPYHGHPTDCYGEYLFGRPIIAYDFQFQLWWKTGIFFSSNFCDMKKAMPVDFGEIKMLFWVRKKAS